MKSSHREFLFQQVRGMFKSEFGSRPSNILLSPMCEHVYKLDVELQDGRRYHGRVDITPAGAYAIDVCLAPGACSCFA